MASRRWFQQAAIVAGAPGVQRPAGERVETWRQAIRDLAAGGGATDLRSGPNRDASDAHACARPSRRRRVSSC